MLQSTRFLTLVNFFFFFFHQYIYTRVDRTNEQTDNFSGFAYKTMEPELGETSGLPQVELILVKLFALEAAEKHPIKMQTQRLLSQTAADYSRGRKGEKASKKSH